MYNVQWMWEGGVSRVTFFSVAPHRVKVRHSLLPNFLKSIKMGDLLIRSYLEIPRYGSGSTKMMQLLCPQRGLIWLRILPEGRRNEKKGMISWYGHFNGSSKKKEVLRKFPKSWDKRDHFQSSSGSTIFFYGNQSLLSHHKRFTDIESFLKRDSLTRFLYTFLV
jgi:hypothetical protein